MHSDDSDPDDDVSRTGFRGRGGFGLESLRSNVTGSGTEVGVLGTNDGGGAVHLGRGGIRADISPHKVDELQDRLMMHLAKLEHSVYGRVGAGS